MARSGRDTGLTSHELLKIFQELKRGNKSYAPNFELCRHPGCRNGAMINNSSEKSEDCPVCSGWGILRKG